MLERFLAEDGESLGHEKKNSDVSELFKSFESLPFYFYKGTLTHPECKEAKWVVVKEPLKAKRETIEVFTSFISQKGKFLLGNTREL